MTSFVMTPATVGGELHGLRYEQIAVGKFALPQVVFYLGSARVALDIADAHDLAEALPNLLAQHDYAEFLSEDSRAVA
ncbi:hypothetical protein [Nocardia brasiliensis]|uniref:hypothetical protein n=1 Tax=Nocardia brasiliensis TaxID=37326 RepID=UPI0004A6ED50|nr:hypothetical protein [Nocardia brasiliensis]